MTNDDTKQTNKQDLTPHSEEKKNPTFKAEKNLKGQAQRKFVCRTHKPWW